jgi:hypothetical protein
MVAESCLSSGKVDNERSIEDAIESATTTLRASLNALSAQSEVTSKKSQKKLKQEEEMFESKTNSGFQSDLLLWRQSFIFSMRNLISILSTNKNIERGNVHMVECTNNFRNLADRMNYISHSHFGIDTASLHQLYLFGYQCSIVVAALERVSGLNFSITDLPDYSGSPLGKLCKDLQQKVEKDEVCTIPWLLESILKPLLHTRLQIPPLYFQVLRHTFVQLEIEINKKHISTSTTTSGPPNFSANATVGQGLVVHFSGYVQLGEKTKRKIRTIEINLEKRKLNEDEPEQQTIPIKIVEDSFQVESILHFKKEGSYQVNVQLFLVDQTQTTWKTKINQQLIVQVEPTKITARLGAFT